MGVGVVVVVVGAVQSSRAESKEVGERGSWEDEHGRGVVEPERPVEYLGRCSIVVMGGGSGRRTVWEASFGALSPRSAG